jgi:hypothetical protein
MLDTFEPKLKKIISGSGNIRSRKIPGKKARRKFKALMASRPCPDADLGWGGRRREERTETLSRLEIAELGDVSLITHLHREVVHRPKDLQVIPR